ncbi:MAG: hypothetical protein AAFY37_08095 [Pseudomonadota bacterium]
MWFLLLQILLLLLLAAVMGALFAIWWMRNRYEDVTETHESLLRGAGQTAVPANILTREDFQVGLSGFNAPDLEPVNSRLSDLETAILGIKPDSTDLTPIDRRLALLEQRLGGLSAIEQKLAALPGIDQKLAGLSQIERRLEGLARIESQLEQQPASTASVSDDDPITKRLTVIESRLSDPAEELQPVHTRLINLERTLGALTRNVAELRNADISPVERQLEALDKKLDGLGGGASDSFAQELTGLKGAVARLREPDIRPLELRMTRLEEAISNFKGNDVDVSGLEAGLLRLEEAFTTPSGQDLDLTPLRGQIASLDARVVDLGQRLAAVREADMDVIRSGLTSLSAGSPSVNLDPIIQRLDALRGQLSAPDEQLDAIAGRLATLEGAIRLIDTSSVDVDPLHGRLAALDDTVQALRAEVAGKGGTDLSQVERQLASLREAVGGLGQQDFSAITNSLRTLDNRQDLVAVENRLTAIEYGLAAVHHMLRQRPETAPDRFDLDAAMGFSDLRTTPATETKTSLSAPPPRDRDPINSARRTGDKANLLTEAAFGQADDLEQISGVGPMLRQLLNETGVYYFWQIAEWSPQDVDYVDEKLQHFKGRISRDDWVGQASTLAALASSAKRPV